MERMRGLVEKVVTVTLESGLQARPAAQFVQEANRYNADLFLEKSGKKINAKSIMGLMSLAIMPGEEVRLIADGEDEENAMEGMISFITKTAIE